MKRPLFVIPILVLATLLTSCSATATPEPLPPTTVASTSSPASASPYRADSTLIDKTGQTVGTVSLSITSEGTIAANLSLSNPAVVNDLLGDSASPDIRLWLNTGSFVAQSDGSSLVTDGIQFDLGKVDLRAEQTFDASAASESVNLLRSVSLYDYSSRVALASGILEQ